MPSAENPRTSERDIDLVLVTGAGASAPLGVRDTRLPLMGEWSDALVERLAAAGLASLKVTGLEKGLDAIEFETRLGKFLRQVGAFSEVEDVVAASTEFPLPAEAQGLAGYGVLESWFSSTKHHFEQVIDVIRGSLYELFAEPAVDLAKARSAYSDLLAILRIGTSDRWLYATTNYDTIAELALEQIGYVPDWGAPSRVRSTAERPLQVERLLDGMPRYLPLLHLHGSIGWYRRSDIDEAYAAPVTRHDPGFGIPIVMLPDPAKAYASDPVINSIWLQFNEALGRAKRVVVLGHSLNDAAIVEALQANVDPISRLAITFFTAADGSGHPDPSSEALYEKIRSDLQPAFPIPIRFGEDLGQAQAHFAQWFEREAAKGY